MKSRPMANSDLRPAYWNIGPNPFLSSARITRARCYHADQGRVDMVEVEAVEPPVTQAGRQVAHLVNGGLWTAGP